MAFTRSEAQGNARPQDWALGKEGEAAEPEAYFTYVEDSDAEA